MSRAGIFDHAAIAGRRRELAPSEPEPVAPDPHAGEERMQRGWDWASPLPAGTLLHCDFCPHAWRDCWLDCAEVRAKAVAGDGVEVGYP